MRTNNDGRESSTSETARQKSLIKQVKVEDVLNRPFGRPMLHIRTQRLSLAPPAISS